ncbi:nucleobase-ascorbate transporter 7 [Actinidia rufa]|uniref:Nucleobase-ascorbate transporter 7 n=1 Tax=Actinidia rufa TaxID=165716 RepID=A0A7J0HE79_9ERIC|nr:nucleobase-ascorbate transporter 7 [Actinidia rufa]
MAGGGGGGAGPQPKQDELQPHPSKDQLPNISYCITSPPPWPEAILLGFQHYLVMLGTTVLIPSFLVPQMGGGNEEKAKVIQTLLFVAGLNTLMQTLFGTCLPAVIGGSYTFVPTTLSIILAGRYNDILNPVEKFEKIMRGIQGSLIVASTLQIVIGFSGLWRNVARLLSPLSVVPLVALTGFGLYELGFPLVAKCVEIGIPQLIFLLIFSQYIPHLMKGDRQVFDRFAVIFSVIIVWIYAHLLTVGGAYKHTGEKTQNSCRTDRAGIISGSPWIRVPYPFQWGAPTFDAGEAFAMMAASFVSLVESTGAFYAVSRYAGATPIPPSVLSRGVGWQEYLEPRMDHRYQWKFGAVFASIPGPIIAALYCLFFAYVGAGGLSFLQFCNLNSFRTKFILGFSIFMGLSIPQYFNEYTARNGYGPVHTGARWFNDMINVPFSSEPFVAGVLALFLDVTLHQKDNQSRKDRGMHWWDRFRSFKTDTRSDEFYSLPFNLNKYFPAV